MMSSLLRRAVRIRAASAGARCLQGRLSRAPIRACFHGSSIVMKSSSSDQPAASSAGPLSDSADPGSTNGNGRVSVPPSVIVLPLFKRPVFPGIVAPVIVPNGPFAETLQALRNGFPMQIGLFLAKDMSGRTGVTKLAHIHPIGLLAQVMRVFPHKQGQSQVILIGIQRIKAKSLIETDNRTGPMSVSIESLPDDPIAASSNDVVRAYTNEIVLQVKELLALRPMFKEQFTTIVEQADLSLPGDLADCVAGLTSADTKSAQAVLEQTDVTERLKQTLSLIKREVEYGAMQAKLNGQMDGTMNKNHRRFVLMEQLKSIKRELGMENDEKDTLMSKFQARLENREVPDTVQATINEEFNKLAGLEPSSSEFAVTRNYLDWLTILPWGQSSPENFDLSAARDILNDDHYGLDDVKDRILELIAVGALKGTVNGKILCLVGPPGVGKTSIGKSIARALHRKFFRFSVGGMSDVAEIKGHRRTYVGAMPGKPIQALKVTQTCNPVLLIDEIDKIGRGQTGDPGSSLLEVLDPEQNKMFLDHYLDVPFDVSQVLFLVTANSLSTIPRPLLDRMEVIELTGYVSEEKVAIAERYLVPRAMEDCGLKPTDVKFDDNVLRTLITNYCREAGVRNLEQHIEKILRKVTLQIASHQSQQVFITLENLHEYVGHSVFKTDRYHERTPPGVVMALAWNTIGGSTMYIESIGGPIRSGSNGGSLLTTGSLGDVMTESTNIALSYAKTFIAKYQPNNDYFDAHNLHMHVPNGGTPKEGPSAGCAMVTSLLSIALDRPVLADLAMTGEVTLTGKVLRIGGVKEKTMAAKRSGATTLIFPIENHADFMDLPDYIREGVDARFVSDYHEIFDIALSSQQQESIIKDHDNNPVTNVSR